MASLETLQLGSLTLVGERRGLYIAVRSERDYADGATVCYLTATEWHSLLALADTKLAREREVERLREERDALRSRVNQMSEIVAASTVIRDKHAHVFEDAPPTSDAGIWVAAIDAFHGREDVWFREWMKATEFMTDEQEQP